MNTCVRTAEASVKFWSAAKAKKSAAEAAGAKMSRRCSPLRRLFPGTPRIGCPAPGTRHAADRARDIRAAPAPEAAAEKPTDEDRQLRIADFLNVLFYPQKDRFKIKKTLFLIPPLPGPRSH